MSAGFLACEILNAPLLENSIVIIKINIELCGLIVWNVHLLTQESKQEYASRNACLRADLPCNWWSTVESICWTDSVWAWPTRVTGVFGRSSSGNGHRSEIIRGCGVLRCATSWMHFIVISAVCYALSGSIEFLAWNFLGNRWHLVVI